MTPQQEAAFDRKAEKHFRSHREIPNGRDFRWNNYRFDLVNTPAGRAIDNFRNNFDSVFPDAPGSGV